MALDYSELPAAEAVRAARTSSRRRQVLDAAVKAMGKTGFHQMSMQDLATEAKVSVGLIYRYFGGKRLAAGIRRYIEIVDDNLDAVVLTYRESRTLDAAGRARIKELEIATAAPLRAVIEAGIADGVFHAADVDLVVYDIMLLAHGWAPNIGISGRATTSTNTSDCRPIWLPARQGRPNREYRSVRTGAP